MFDERVLSDTLDCNHRKLELSVATDKEEQIITVRRFCQSAFDRVEVKLVSSSSPDIERESQTESSSSSVNLSVSANENVSMGSRVT